jgi:hypothetical protein
MRRKQAAAPARAAWTRRQTVAALVVAGLLIGAYLLGRAACPSDVLFKIRGVYDESIARDCLARGDTIVAVIDLTLAETGAAGHNEFACAATGSLQSLTERAK